MRFILTFNKKLGDAWTNAEPLPRAVLKIKTESLGRRFRTSSLLTVFKRAWINKDVIELNLILCT